MANSTLHNEPELLQLIADGDEQAFEQLYRHYYAQLKPLVRKYRDAGMDDEEILQQTFLKVWLNRDKLPEIENIRAWIYKIAYREFLTGLRTRVNYESKLQQYSTTLDTGNKLQLPMDTAHLDDIRKCIRDVVDSLPPQRKTIYEMNRIDGMKISEIADKLSISTQTVKNVLFIVLKSIREKLIASGYGPLSILIFLKII